MTLSGLYALFSKRDFAIMRGMFLYKALIFLLLLLPVSVKADVCPQNIHYQAWSNCEGGRNYEDVGFYLGKYRDGLPNGLGTIKYENGFVYIGDISQGLPDGDGTLTDPNGDILVGTFENGNLADEATIYGQNGDIFKNKPPFLEFLRTPLR